MEGGARSRRISVYSGKLHLMSLLKWASQMRAECFILWCVCSSVEKMRKNYKLLPIPFAATRDASPPSLDPAIVCFWAAWHRIQDKKLFRKFFYSMNELCQLFSRTVTILILLFYRCSLFFFTFFFFLKKIILVLCVHCREKDKNLKLICLSNRFTALSTIFSLPAAF